MGVGKRRWESQQTSGFGASLPSLPFVLSRVTLKEGEVQVPEPTLALPDGQATPGAATKAAFQWAQAAV